MVAAVDSDSAEKCESVAHSLNALATAAAAAAVVPAEVHVHCSTTYCPSRRHPDDTRGKLRADRVTSTVAVAT